MAVVYIFGTAVGWEWVLQAYCSAFFCFGLTGGFLLIAGQVKQSEEGPDFGRVFAKYLEDDLVQVMHFRANCFGVSPIPI